jgi:hypothetical protein
MLIATRSCLLALLLLSSVGFTACSDKNEAPAPPDPAAAFELSPYFDFTTIAPGGGTAHSGSGVAHPSQDIAGTARLDAPSNMLVLDFKAAPDEVYFEVDQTQLRSGWTGAYALRCQSRPSDPVFVSYLHTQSPQVGTAILRLSDWTPQRDGHVTITAYDAQRQLVSGSYEIMAPNQRDPSKPANPSGPLCTVLLTGKFTNLKVKP